MMQPYCRAKVRRGERVEECGRVLPLGGRCDGWALHVPWASSPTEPDPVPAPGES